MNTPAAADPLLWLCALNLLLITSLPRIFFRSGRLNGEWWLTAGPFMLAGAALACRMLQPLTGFVMPLTGTAPPLLQLPATILAAASIALIGFTLGSHREPVSLWHQPDDQPARLVRHGAYARIRHPFYTAFLLALAACLSAAPEPMTAAALLAGVFRLRQTAVREESRLLASPLGAEYAAYMNVTGRFLPLPRTVLQSRRPERTTSVS